MQHTRLTFLGAAGTVTGSRTLVETRNRKLLVDCGLFQGTKPNREKNWEAFPMPASELDAVLLTHAHIDHIGYLPRLKIGGFNGPIHCTDATADLVKILLPDTGHLQEEEARWANKRGYSRHKPALPLFTEKDAVSVLGQLQPVPYGAHFHPIDGFRAQYRDTGHILGAAFLDLKAERLRGTRKLVFSGDLGRPTDAILRAPSQPYNVDYLVLESTYGDRLHEPASPAERLATVINEALARGGVIVIPSFAVGRTQTVLYTLRELEEAGAIPKVPVYVDSPMAIQALEAHRNHIADLNLICRKQAVAGTRIFHPEKLRLSVTREDSQKINDIEGGAIIIASSGMAVGGRVLHHLHQRLPNPKNTVLFIGYQAEGTRGQKILSGAPVIRMFGEEVPVQAKIERIEGYSGHADWQEILAWLMGFNKAPERVFLTHGEPEAAQALARRIKDRFGWDVTVPQQGDSYLLDL